MKNLRSVNGFSLIEVIVSMALLGILISGIMVMTSGPDLKVFSNQVSGGNTCKSEANRVMNNIKNKGLIRNRYSLQLLPGVLPAAGTALPPAVSVAGNDNDDAAGNEAAEALEYGVSYANRWPVAQAPYNFVTNPKTIRPYRLLMGTMTALDAIYNAYTASVCGVAANFLGLSFTAADANTRLLLENAKGIEDVAAGASTGLQNAEAFLKIRPFNTATGALLGACPAGIYTRPYRGGNVGPTNVPSDLNSATTGSANYPPLPNAGRSVGTPDLTSFDNRGWEVTVSVTFLDRNGSTSQCEVKERFQYSTEAANPNTLGVFDRETETVTAIDDTDVSDQMNSTVRTSNAATGTTAVAYNYSAGTGTSPWYTCSAAAPTRNVAFRVTRVRPGSILMCRNLTAQRPINFVTIDSATTSHLTLAATRRTTFFSNEMFKHPTFAAADSGDGVFGDAFFTGLPYPAGTYYCNSANGCHGLPRLSSTGVTSTISGEVFERPSSHAADTNVGTWTPCENTVITCATSANNNAATTYIPSVARFVAGDATHENAYHLTYNNLPIGCEVHLQMAEVDAAYNVKATELREYIQESLPGDKLCLSGGTWQFACSSVPSALNALPACPLRTARVGITPATYFTSFNCCITYPDGIMGPDLNTTRSIDP